MISRTAVCKWRIPCAVLLLLLFTLSCGSTDSGDRFDDPEGFQDGILIEVREILGEDFIRTIENDLDMPIHRGANPPDIEARFSQITQKSAFVSASSGITMLMSPYELVQTNVPSDAVNNIGPGHRFLDSYIRLRNQNMETYSIGFDSVQPDNPPRFGENGYIIGEGDRFTVFGLQEQVHEEGSIWSMRLFSGVLTDTGVDSPYAALITVDNGNVSGAIPNGTGRSFKAGNGVATLADWPEEQPQKQPATGFFDDMTEY